MKIGGVSILLISGIINLMILAFQLASGLRWIKIPMTIHRRMGILLFIIALVHAAIGILVH